MSSSQFLTFVVGPHLFGLEVHSVQEVIRYQPMTRVPLAPASVGGLINLRGQVITAVDLRQRLDLPARADDELPMNVVVRTDDGAVSLLVDSIGPVLEARDSDFEAPPETLVGPTRQVIRGAYKRNDRLLLAVDVRKAIEIMLTPAA